jgi:LPS sulfotransferase NodH
MLSTAPANRNGSEVDRRPSNVQQHAAEPQPEVSAPFRNWMDPRLDFPRSTPLRKSYIVAASYRCGSTFFCSELWRTGVLGAPAEYLNIGEGRQLRDVMMARLQAVSAEDYVAKLLARRTSRNGMFGIKAHFHHFEAALDWYPSLLRALAPIAFVYLNRRDKLAQAVSMAKAIQTDAWTSMDRVSESPLRYDEALIARCLEDIREQTLDWLRWFEVNNITPFVVNYEALVADTPEEVRRILELLDVQGDEPEEVHPPPSRKQGDATNREWLARFRREMDWQGEFDDGPDGGPLDGEPRPASSDF